MNFAEGKGPKQVKRAWPLGKFVTLYGNGVQSNVNPAPVSYPTAFSGGQVGNLNTTGSVGYTQPGSVVPGLVVNSGNGHKDVGFVCSPGSSESIQDLETTVATLTAETTWSGSCVVSIQGTQNRYYGTTNYSSTNWVTISSATVTTANVPVLVKINSASGILYNAYRLIASGGTGIIDWAIAGMFTDISAMQVGANAGDTNGGIGQLQIQNVRNLTLSGGTITNNQGADPYENIKADHTWIG